MSETAAVDSVPVDACKLLTVVVPDDGTDLALMKALRTEKGIVRANSISCLGVAILQDARAKPGALPEPIMVRRIEILVPEDRADEVFDFIFEAANLNRPGGGAVLQSPAALATLYALPEGVPDEAE